MTGKSVQIAIPVGARVRVEGRGDAYDGRFGAVARGPDTTGRMGVRLETVPPMSLFKRLTKAYREGVFWFYPEHLIVLDEKGEP